MTDRQIKVGDVVDWYMVPNSALVLRGDAYFRRSVRGGHVMGVQGQLRSWETWNEMGGDADAWPWHEEHGEKAVIIALDVPADATADDLRTLAEVFEVREALFSMSSGSHATESALENHIRAAATGLTFGDLKAAFHSVANRLHRAGWRPNMTAEDAARLLAEAG